MTKIVFVYEIKLHILLTAKIDYVYLKTIFENIFIMFRLLAQTILRMLTILKNELFETKSNILDWVR